MGKTIIRAATCFLILCVIISGIIPAMAADANWNKPVKTVKSTGRTIASNGKVLSTDLFAKVLKVHDEVGGWFILTVPENVESLTFSVLCPKLKHGQFKIRFYRADDFSNNKWTEIQQLIFAAGKQIQTGTLVNLKEGDIIAWWNDDCGGKAWTLQQDFKMMITPNVPSVIVSE